jgi:PAS domain S-box-containing protein
MTRRTDGMHFASTAPLSPPITFIVVAVVAVGVVAVGIVLRRYELAYSARLRALAEHEAQASSRELRDLKYAIDQASIVAVTDARGRITYINDNFCRIAKYTRDELLGQDHEIINSGFHPPEFVRSLWLTIAGGRVWKGEIRNRAKDGTYYWVNTTIVPFLDERGTPYQYLAIHDDITARKNAEATLVSQAAMARLGELGAVVAHEVRNPLAGIRGGLQVLQQRAPSNSSDQAVMGEMIRRVDALNDRVTDLLRYARPRAARLARVELRSVIEATTEMVRRDPAMKNVQIAIAGDPVWAHADAEWLREAFLNLLLNAAQAMDARGVVRVTVDSNAVITVCDQGPGIPIERREQVFEPFFTTKPLGTGLGLAIVKRLVELQGGTVVAEDAPTGGAQFVVRLAREDATTAAVPTPQAS